MTYGYYGAKGSRKQSKTKTLEVRRILASLAMTAGLLVYPFSVGEAAIVRRDETTISPTNNVYNIDPEGKIVPGILPTTDLKSSAWSRDKSPISNSVTLRLLPIW